MGTRLEEIKPPEQLDLWCKVNVSAALGSTLFIPFHLLSSCSDLETTTCATKPYSTTHFVLHNTTSAMFLSLRLGLDVVCADASLVPFTCTFSLSTRTHTKHRLTNFNVCKDH